MFIFRLFHRDRPFQQVDSRMLAEGSMTVGRDPEADWPLDDADGTLSRIHCSLAVEDGRLILRDSSSNGTYLGNGERAPRHEGVEVEVREVIRLGALSILIDRPSEENGADLAATRHVPLSTVPAPVPTSWSDVGGELRPAHRDASLIEAFCEGANLDASALSGEDPAELMRRVGAIYQQTVLGLATLLAERTRLKSEYQLERTTIGAANNNPFKWAPTRRLAQDLLCTHDTGFLTDADAVRASFEDLADHLAALATGANAATDLVIATLAPESIDAEAKAEGFSLRSGAASRWEIHSRRYAALAAKDRGRDSAISRAFAEAYSRASDTILR
jgi:predicted component of type VI protein secretion system